MNERQLEHVVAAVETGSFTLAAQRCGIAQPSLSGSVARIERELGLPLFHRVGRRIVPTDACRAMLPAARDAIRAVERVRRAAGAVHAGLSGHLDVVVQPAALGPAVALIGRIRSEQPGVAVTIRSPGEDETVGEVVAAGRSELGIGDVEERDGLVWTPIGAEPYVLVEPPGARERRRRPTVSDLRGLPLVLPPRGSATRIVIDSLFLAAGIDPVVAVEVDHREALLLLVASGAGSTIVSASMVPEGTAANLRISELSPRAERRIGIVARNAPRTPAADHLLAVAGGR